AEEAASSSRVGIAHWGRWAVPTLPLAVDGEDGIDFFLVGDGVDHVSVGFSLAGFECAQQASRAVLVASLDASGRWFQSSDVFVSAPMLPVGAAREIFDVVVNRHG